MMFENATDLLYELNVELLGSSKKFTRQACVSQKAALCRAFRSELCAQENDSCTVLLLDEIDQLASTDKKLLDSIFALASDPACHLSVIGVANSLDLTARHLPVSLQPLATCLYFAPYQVEDLVAILTDRMQKANEGAGRLVIQSLAVELCSRKVAAIGDLRKALEIMQLAFDVAEEEIEMTRSGTKDCQIELKHVVKAMDRAFSSGPSISFATANRQVASLNMNARMILVGLIRFQDENPAPTGTRLPYKKPTLQAIYERYVALLRVTTGRMGSAVVMEAVSRDEFLTLVATMETFGLVTVGPSSNATASQKKKATAMQDWQSSLLKLNVPDRAALITELQQGGITRMFL